ncbi:TM0106 family RecB-like putative nuclease [Tomitella biformata]|uniref:TM0106 family RecB-like putative nuclease n=1 Tax=Tomitella biformata TaxID=630403 RepID=UPI0004B63763|nr:TM0106 family RecB-like putative nuclease [Tomitella biformata]
MTTPSAAPPTRPVVLGAAELTRCRHRIFKQSTAPVDLPMPELATGVKQRQDAAREHRAQIGETLRRQHPGSWVDASRPERDGPRHRSRREITEDAMLDGVDRIWQAAFVTQADTGRRGHAELLIRDAENGGYIPVLVVNHKVTDPGSGAVTSTVDKWAPAVDERRKVRSQARDQVRLAHLTRMLENLGMATPAQVGGTIGYDADCMLTYELGGENGILASYDGRWADRQGVAQGLIETVPARISECSTCPWWADLGPVRGCSEVLREMRDVSLVVRGEQAVRLREMGIGTIDQLAAWDGPEPEEWRGNGFADAIIGAQAWLADVLLVRRHDEVAVPRADVEVDVDMESYQEFGAYLWGTFTTSDGVDAGYRPFVTWDPLPTEDEARSFAEFWTWLMRMLEDTVGRGRTFAAYCYSQNAENKWLLGSARRFEGRPGIPPLREVQDFIESEHWVDVFQYVGEHFVSPHGKGLKVLARYAGFDWRDAEASGEASMTWYRAAVGYDGPVDDTQRARLLEYNEDDVRATKILREWMSEVATGAVLSVADLRERQFGPGSV